MRNLVISLTSILIGLTIGLGCDTKQTIEEIEYRTKANLAGLRSALFLFHCDRERRAYPTDPAKELVKAYLEVIPRCECAPYHAETYEIRLVTESNGKPLRAFVEDTGKWLYMADKDSREWGKIIIDCSHTDHTGIKWCDY